MHTKSMLRSFFKKNRFSSASVIFTETVSSMYNYKELLADRDTKRFIDRERSEKRSAKKCSFKSNWREKTFSAFRNFQTGLRMVLLDWKVIAVYVVPLEGGGDDNCPSKYDKVGDIKQDWIKQRRKSGIIILSKQTQWAWRRRQQNSVTQQ